MEPEVAWMSVDTHGATCVNLFLGSTFDSYLYHAVLTALIAEAL